MTRLDTAGGRPETSIGVAAGCRGPAADALLILSTRILVEVPA
jgi:hypothetical protein